LRFHKATGTKDLFFVVGVLLCTCICTCSMLCCQCHTFTHTHTHAHIHTHPPTYTHSLIHTHTYIHKYTLTHTYTYTCAGVHKHCAQEDKELTFQDLMDAPLPKCPREPSLAAHWLAIEGVQPAIRQNPSEDGGWVGGCVGV
jgi:hypothetical protein